MALDKFRGSLSAADACAAVARGARRGGGAGVEVVVLPVADGGEGTLDALEGPLRLSRRSTKVRGPLGAPRRATFGFRSDGLAVLETARAIGLSLIPEGRRDPLRTSTAGAGDLLRAAARQGAKRVLVALGGSATVDGGSGALEALGVVFRDARGRPVRARGGSLHRIRSADWSAIDPRVERLEGAILCDVRNPLLGPRGAAPAYGPQKGAPPATVRRLAEALASFARVLAERSPRAGALARAPGAGAAGGLAFGLAVALGWPLRPGGAQVLSRIGFARRLRAADVAITGEGRWDGAAHPGKAAHEVLARCARAGVPAVLICGRLAGPVPRGVAAWDRDSLPARPARLAAADLESLAARAIEALGSWPSRTGRPRGRSRLS